MINKGKIGKIITFYSFKGGVGRTMALANVAVLLAKNRLKKVLIIDWDLEAPGLHRYFEDPENTNTQQKGLIDLLLDFKAFFAEKTPNTSEIRAFLQENFHQNYIVPIEKSKNGRRESVALGRLFMMKAGRLDANYAANISEFDWDDFFDTFPYFYETLVGFLQDNYDFTLLDSRTGYTDSSGVCTMILPEYLVTVFTLNDQSLEGLQKVCSRTVSYRRESGDARPLAILPLMSRVDASEYGNEEFESWKTKAKKTFEKELQETYNLEENTCNLTKYFDHTAIVYASTYSYGEKIAAIIEGNNIADPISNVFKYNNLCNILEEELNAWDAFSTDTLDLPALYLTEKDPSRKYQILKNHAFQFYIKDEYDKAIPFYEQCWAENDKDVDVAFNLGFAYYKLEKYDLAIESYKKATELKPDSHEAWYNMGNAYYGLGNYDLAIKSYKKAIEIKPDKQEAWDSLAFTYLVSNQYLEAKKIYTEKFSESSDGAVYMNLGHIVLIEKNENEAKTQYLKGFELYGNRKKYIKDMNDDLRLLLKHYDINVPFYKEMIAMLEKKIITV